MFSNSLKSIMNKKKITAQEIADKLGVGRGTVTHWSNGERFPRDESYIQQLANILGVSISELFGEMPKSLPAPNNESFELIRHTSILAGAGEAEHPESYAEELDPVPVYKNFLNGCSPKHLEIMQVHGDSMSPTLLPDDYVIVDMVHDRHVDYINGIYLVSVNGSIQIKRLEFLGTAGIDIISDNVNYRTRNTQADGIDLQIIGKLFKHVKSLGALQVKAG